jgi:hypothetical protein
MHFAARDPLKVVVMNRMLAGESTRKYASVAEPVGEEVERESRSMSTSRVSELFIERTRTALEEVMCRRLEDLRPAVMTLDGIDIADRTHVVALGITTDGVKIPRGLWEGSTENATLARSLLSDLVDRGPDPEQAILFVVGVSLFPSRSEAAASGQVRSGSVGATLKSGRWWNRVIRTRKHLSRSGPRRNTVAG